MKEDGCSKWEGGEGRGVNQSGANARLVTLLARMVHELPNRDK